MSKKNQDQVTRVEKQAKAFDMVVQGSSFRQVADALDVSRSTALTYFRTVMDSLKIPDEKIKEWRILVSARLDFTIAPMLQALAAHNKFVASSGSSGVKLSIRDMGDIARAVARVEDRRARMLGTDKPSKIDITHNIPALDPENAALRIAKLLRDAQFPPMDTGIPIAMLPAPSKEANGNSDKAS